MTASGSPFPGIEPVEIWDLPVGGKTLQEWRSSEAFGEHLATAVLGMRAAPPSSFRPRARALAGAFERVHIVGGGADDALSRAIAARGLPCTRTDDAFAAARAGAALAGVQRCADVGQTAIKLVERDRTWRVARDVARAPLRDEVPMARRAAARASTLAFLAEVIGLGLAPETSILLGLPCELTEDGLPRSCTYCWPDPDPTLRATLERATGASIALANDAELAALAAASVLPPGPPTLVLTVGFAVGGALLA